MDEYVPTITPMIKPIAKPDINSPPNISRVNKTSKVVNEVTMVLPNV